MNPRMVCLIAPCLAAVLLFTGCANTDPSFIPSTGEESRIPAAVELVQVHVLEYVVSSSRLATAPSGLEWQLDDEQYEGEYRFHSGDWLMVIWHTDAGEENQRVVITNKAEHVHWCGYVRPDGGVVDTSYMP